MKKKYLVGVIVLVISLFVVFNLSSNHKETEELYKEINESHCNEMKTAEMKKTCLAMFEKNLSICEGMPYFNEYCYDKVFILMENFSESLCEKLSKYYPKTTCYIRLAEIKKDESFCKKAGGRYQECSWKLAKLLKKPELCSAIEVDCEKNQCLAEVTGNASYCEKVPDVQEKKACYAKLLKNVSACGEYIPEYGEILYIPICLYDLAKTTNNISLCWNITRKETKWQCLAELSKDKRVCNESESQFWKDFCLVEILKNKLVERKY